MKGVLSVRCPWGPLKLNPLGDSGRKHRIGLSISLKYLSTDTPSAGVITSPVLPRRYCNGQMCSHSQNKAPGRVPAGMASSLGHVEVSAEGVWH